LTSSTRLAPFALGTLLAAILAAAPPPETRELGQGHTLTPRASFTDDLGQTHTRLIHRYQGLRVWGSETIVHADPDLESRPAALPRALPVQEAAPADAGSFPMPDLTPSIVPETAHAAIRAHLGGEGAMARLTSLETVLFPQMVSVPAGPAPDLNAAQVYRYPAAYALAFLVRAEASQPWDYLVDAHTGEVLQRIPLRHPDSPAKGTGQTLHSGKVTLDTTATSSGFRLQDPTRGKADPGDPARPAGNAVTDLGGTASEELGPVFRQDTGAGNSWGDGKPETRTTRLTAPTAVTVAADAAFGIQSAWDYFLKIHKRLGWDGQGTAMVTRVHEGSTTDNAAWNDWDRTVSICMPGDDWPHSDLFTVAHEFSHAVTDTTAKLKYRDESGGLNEATSDIFGTMVNAFVKNGAKSGSIGDANSKWTITSIPARTPDTPRLARDMIKPSNDGKSPDTWVPFIGDLDPHYASGPMNRAFHFLSQGATIDPALATTADPLKGGMTGIGNDKAARIWFRALTAYLTPDSTYLDARQAALNAARDLYGADKAENIAVRKAFGAIKVGDPAASKDDFELPKVAAVLEQTQADKQTLASGALTLTAHVSDNDKVASVAYFMDNVPLAVSSAPPYRVTVKDTGLLMANGTHELQTRALDASGNTGTAAAKPLTLSNFYHQLIRDPGLELPAGVSHWTGDLTILTRRDRQGRIPPHGGSRYAAFSGLSKSLSQVVTVNPNAREVTLKFWAWVSTAMGTGDAVLRVQVRSVPPAGGTPVVLATPVTLTAQDAWEDWIPHLLDLSKFSGQKVEIRFQFESGLGEVAFNIDDITLVCGSVPVSVGIAPARLALLPGTRSAPLKATVFGSSNQAVTWSLREPVEALDEATQTFKAPAQPGFYHAIATSVANPAASAELSIQVFPKINVRPAAATVETGASQAFNLILAPGVTAAVNLQEGVQAGTAARPGGGTEVVYTAPDTPGSYHLLVSDPADASATVSVLLTVVRPRVLVLSPATWTMATGSTTWFRVSLDGYGTTAVDWNLQEGSAAGTIEWDPEEADSPLALYTAPATPGTYHLLATSKEDPARKAAATVTVVDAMVVAPARMTLTPEEAGYFVVSVPGQGRELPSVAWTATGGTFSSGSIYRAPAKPGTYTVTARTRSGPARSATAIVEVKSLKLANDGMPAVDLADLAILADAFGQIARDGEDLVTDLNGDGRIDDTDVLEGIEAFELAQAPAPAPAAPANPRLLAFLRSNPTAK
jgi:Zn-dependent metalloprotease